MVSTARFGLSETKRIPACECWNPSPDYVIAKVGIFFQINAIINKKKQPFY